jgi:hypothetical protein
VPATHLPRHEEACKTPSFTVIIVLFGILVLFFAFAHLVGYGESKKAAAPAAACCHKQCQRASFGVVILVFDVFILYLSFAHLAGDAEAKKMAAPATTCCEKQLRQAALLITLFNVIEKRFLGHVRFLYG